MSITVNIYFREKTVLWWLATVVHSSLGSLVLQQSKGKAHELSKKIVEIISLNNDISYQFAKILIELLLPIYNTTNFPTFKYNRCYKQTYSSLLKSIHRLELESTCNAIVRQFRIIMYLLYTCTCSSTTCQTLSVTSSDEW